MDLENRTQLEAAVLRGGLPDGEQTLAVVVAKASAVFDSNGCMVLDPSLRTPVCHEPTPHAGGVIPADLAPRKQGLDVLALGEVYHPDPAGGSMSEVVVQVGGCVRRLSVFGERYWCKSRSGGWVASEPMPFSMLALSWDRSFGGISFSDEGEECPHPLHPDGVGYVASEAAIEGTSLPNFEDPEELIAHPFDQPAPFNLAPAARHLAVDPRSFAAEVERCARDAQPFVVPDGLWNDALPRFRFDGVAPGAPVSLTGMSERPLHGALPSFRLYADASVGARRRRVPLVLDTLLFLPEAQRALLTFRGSFRYRFAPHESRRVTLEMET